MNPSRRETPLYSIPLILLGMFLVLFPLLFSAEMTESFLLPKHLLLAVIVSISMIILGLQMASSGKIRLRSTPFDIPVLAFTSVIIISAYLSLNKYDALIAAVPFLYAALLFYTIVNTVRNGKSLLFLLSCLVAGASLTALLTISSYFKLYLLPFSYTRSQYFTSIGNLIDQAVYLAMVLPVAGYFTMRLLNSLNTKTRDNKPQISDMFFSAAFLVISLGFIITVYYLLTKQKPLLLPLSNGFQIAFAAVSQDTGRLLKSFLFGSGYGTFVTDFMRFKQPSFNLDNSIWSATFLHSSSFILELLATSGLLGVLSYLVIIYKIIREKDLFLPLLILIVSSFVLPFSPILITIFFAVLGIYAAARFQNNAKNYDEIELHLVAFSENSGHHGSASPRSRYSVILPAFIALLIIGAIATADYYILKYTVSDVYFKNSLVAAAQKNGSLMYKLQTKAVQTFPYRDMYQRVLSQNSLKLANALAKQTPQGATPSAQTQQTVLSLIQQSINVGRSATTISPLNAANWNNLSAIYRNLIGFGKNAEQFAILTNKQAAVLDPANPQQYVNLGGIYYQLGLYDDALRQFQLAIQLKPDYANAYYNAGHALEAKNNLTQAVTVYQAVKRLVKDDPKSSSQITSEIDALKKKINEQQSNVAGASTAQTENSTQKQPANSKLNINKPSAQLPSQSPQAEISGPTISLQPTLSPKLSSPTPSAGVPTPTP